MEIVVATAFSLLDELNLLLFRPLAPESYDIVPLLQPFLLARKIPRGVRMLAK